MTPSGLVRARATLTNTHTSEPYWVDAVHVALPVPPVADELLDLAGRHTRERAPQRQPFHVGTRLRESRRGHGGHDASLLLVAGTSGFGFRSGEVWGLHVAWSGNHRRVCGAAPHRRARGPGRRRAAAAGRGAPGAG